MVDSSRRRTRRLYRHLSCERASPMALVILRAIFLMVSIGIAVLMFNSAPMRQVAAWLPWAVLAGMTILPLAVIRSEERRVGKECRALCRSRWSPYH